MARRMTTVAKRDQIRWFIRATQSTRYQMMNIRFTIRAQIAAFLTTPGISRKHDGSHATPMRCTHIDGLHAISLEFGSGCAAGEGALHRIETRRASHATYRASAVVRRPISLAR